MAAAAAANDGGSGDCIEHYFHSYQHDSEIINVSHHHQ